MQNILYLFYNKRKWKASAAKREIYKIYVIYCESGQEIASFSLMTNSEIASIELPSLIPRRLNNDLSKFAFTKKERAFPQSEKSNAGEWFHE